MIDFDFKSEKADIRRFSNFVPIALIVWGTILGFSHGWGGRSEWILYAAAVIIFFWGMISPFTLKPLYLGWMYFTKVFSWFLTTLVLGLVFYIGFGITGLVMRLLGKDPLSRKIDKQVPSYWLKRGTSGGKSSDYERQF